MEHTRFKLADTLPDGFINAGYELPCEGGEYEVAALVIHDAGVVKEIRRAQYDYDTGRFIKPQGTLTVVAWRPYIPDALDLEEFAARGGTKYYGYKGGC